MSFKSKEAILNEINQLFEDLNQGSFDMEKMNQLVNLSRELNERMVILRHQANTLLANDMTVTFEEDVQENEFIDENSEQGVMEEVIIDEISEDEIQQETEENDATISSNNNHPLSVEEKDENFSFDLFGSEEEVSEENKAEDAVHFETKSSAKEVEEEIIDAPISQQSTHFQSTEPAIEPIVEIESSTIETTPIIESSTVDASTNDHVENTIHQTNDSVQAINDSQFFNRYESIRNNPNATMVAPKIEQLTTCFSLNEKLFYIRELFNGSSNDFNQMVEQIDKLQSFDAAKNQLSSIAEQNRWSLDAQVTVDFINKVERRFF